MRYITQSEWNKKPKDYKTIKDGKYFILERTSQGPSLIEVKVLLDKQKSHAFGKDTYLLGEDSEGVRYWLEEGKWDCGWYWGFGYIESYTNNKNPHLSRDISSHQHADNFYNEWWGGDRPKLVKTTFTENEGWELAELFKQFYTLKASAEMFGRGGCHISTSKATKEVLTDTELAKRINDEMIPVVMNRIYEILTPKK